MANDQPEGEQQARQETRPQAPVVIIGRDARFLDVQPTVDQAEWHLSRHETGDPAHDALLDVCDYFDGVARPLRPVVDEDGTVTLELASETAQPERLRARVDDLLGWALGEHGLADLVELGGWEFDERDLEGLLTPPSDASFARFLDDLDQRFNPWTDHSAGRLHNLWHALGG